MKCPICEAPLRPGADRCHDCGYRIPGTQAPQIEPTYARRGTYTPPNKTKRSRGCCCFLALIPLLLILSSALFPLIQGIWYEIENVIQQFVYSWDYEEEWPSEELTPESVPAPADEGCFAIVEGTLMFLPENWDGGPILNIPEFIGGEQVRTIGPGCFQNCADLTTILLPETVTAIGPRAFDGCSNLRGLYLHDGVESIGQDAFAGCISLEAVYIPVSVTHIAEHAFDDCASLLYLFYGGNFEDWDLLYDDYINPFTTAICLDGNYYHGSGE